MSEKNLNEKVTMEFIIRKNNSKVYNFNWAR